MKQTLIGIGSGLAAGSVALGFLFLGPLSQTSDVSATIASQAVVPEATVSASPVEIEPEPTTPEVIRCSVSVLEDAAEILLLQAQVIDTSTGEVLFDRGSGSAARPASVMKLFTAAAALETLGPDYQVTTRVYQDKVEPGKIYLVGAGDPTLSRTGINQNSVYQKAPKLSDLVAQVLKVLEKEAITKIVLDTSLYGGAKGEYQSVWDSRGITNGYMSPVSALQVDGDRASPAAKESQRSMDPVSRAGTWFQEALGASATDAVITKGLAPADSIQIAAVKSRPISEWIDYMLVVSDNTLAEALARLVSLDVGLDGTFGSLTETYNRALRETGLNLAGLTIEDGSGLSKYNQASPELVNNLLRLIDAGYGDFEVILGGMPVSGTPGSLSYRFEDAVGTVTAKTGWIRTGYTLAGFLDTPDQSRLIFTVYNLGDVTASNREAMDDLVMGFYDCGSTLVNR
ncbi:MAG: D-alanyl-D-alanine carboxypeptidase [Aquiluna sp.]|nr:D-alanyl-D-alanine carboxypeptidase [Aquiluna sp.]